MSNMGFLNFLFYTNNPLLNEAINGFWTIIKLGFIPVVFFEI